MSHVKTHGAMLWQSQSVVSNTTQMTRVVSCEVNGRGRERDEKGKGWGKCVKNEWG